MKKGESLLLKITYYIVERVVISIVQFGYNLNYYYEKSIKKQSKNRN